MVTPGVLKDLRVEYLRQPVGIGARRPRFMWKVAHRQSAYQVEVHAGDRRVWASGVVEESATLVEYAGQTIASSTIYRWRVRSRMHAGGWTPWAEASFETGLLDSGDWVASWVEPQQQDASIERWSIRDWISGGGPDSPPEQRLRPPQLLRQSFVARAGLERARLHATARGVYSAFINGVRAGDQTLAPGSDAYEQRISVQTYDVTDAIEEGENIFGMALADGWWAGRLGLTGSSAQFGTRTSAIWQLHLTYEDGTTDIAASGGEACSTVGPWVYSDLFVGECFDRRAVPHGWDRGGFDDSGWEPVIEVGRDYDALRPFSGEPIRRVLEVRAQSIVETPAGSIVDFGQVIAGRVRLLLRDTTPGQRVVIEHTETLAADGSWFDNIVGINKDQTDIFVAAGGADEWEPEFTFHGFRFARVRGLSLPLVPGDITGIVIASDLEQTGFFETSDPRLNRLHENVAWSQRGNFLSVPMDCPQRERAGWAGDIQAFVGAASNNALVLPFLSRWLENLCADQLPDGRIPIFSPRSPFDAEAASNAQGVGSIVASAGWSDAIAIVPWTLYERYGDPHVLEVNYESLTRWVEYQRREAVRSLPDALEKESLSEDRRDVQALLYNAGLHFGDWLTPSTLENRPMHEAVGMAPALTSEFVAPMFQANTLTIAARAARVLGRDADAKDFAERASAVRAAFAAEYVDALGDLPVRLQGLYVLALAFEMVPEVARPLTAARLVQLITERGYRLDTGFLSTPYLLDVLCDNGHREVARRLLWQSGMPSWLYEVDHGATTIWESWDAIAPDGEVRATSLNHYASGAVDDWLYRRIVGIRPLSPGYQTAAIEPGTDMGLDRASGHVGTPFGRLRVEWQRDAEDVVVEVDIPHGVAAVLRVGGTERVLDPGSSVHTVSL